MKENYYQRQTLLPEVGIDGQYKLEQCRVLIIGAGGLGCPALEFLARAGIGTIGVVDNDTVDITNLHRQNLYTVDDIGKKKVTVATQKLKQINPFIQIREYPFMLTAQNALSTITDYDIVLDATDNYPTRYLINDACVLLNKPLVYGAIYRFEGQVGVFNFNGGATYRCLFPNFPQGQSNANCATSGVIGVLPGIIGIMQANEVIKFALNIGKLLNDQLVTYSALTGETSKIKLNRRTDFDYEGVRTTTGLDHPYYTNQCLAVQQIDQAQLMRDIDNDVDIKFIDVRDLTEQPRFDDESVMCIQLQKIEAVSELPTAEKIVVFCKSGVRSLNATNTLLTNFPGRNILSLELGISQNIIDKWNKVR